MRVRHFLIFLLAPAASAAIDLPRETLHPTAFGEPAQCRVLSSPLTLTPAVAAREQRETARTRAHAAEAKLLSLRSAAREPRMKATTGASDPRRYFFYDPEGHLIAETELTTAAQPRIAYHYLWMNGTPAAMIDVLNNVTYWMMTDHLGTPFMMTDDHGAVAWRVEYTPFGEIYGYRAGAQLHQPLRLPGQIALAGSDLSYNMFRFYRSSWGRYTQGDPVGLKGGINLYRYAGANPLNGIDPLGLAVNVICRRVDVGQGFAAKVFGWWFQPVHCRLQVSCPCSDGQGDPKAPFNKTVGLEAANGGFQLNTDEFLAPRFGGASQDYEKGWFNVPVTPPSDSKPCSFERCILNEARARQNTTPQSFPPYSIAGPNSNSYVRNLVDTCGGSAEWPDNAYGANPNPFWGGNYQP